MKPQPFPGPLSVVLLLILSIPPPAWPQPPSSPIQRIDSLVLQQEDSHIIFKDFNRRYFLGMDQEKTALFAFDRRGRQVMKRNTIGRNLCTSATNIGLGRGKSFYSLDENQLATTSFQGKVKHSIPHNHADFLAFDNWYPLRRQKKRLLFPSVAYIPPKTPEFAEKSHLFTTASFRNSRFENHGAIPSDDSLRLKIQARMTPFPYLSQPQNSNRFFVYFTSHPILYQYDASSLAFIREIPLQLDHWAAFRIPDTPGKDLQYLLMIQQNPSILGVYPGKEYVLVYYRLATPDGEAATTIEELASPGRKSKVYWALFTSDGRKCCPDFQDTRLGRIIGFDQHGNLLFAGNSGGHKNVVYTAKIKL